MSIELIRRVRHGVMAAVVAAALLVMAPSGADAAEAPTFTDVDYSKPYAASIRWMAEQGLSTGYPQAGGTRVFKRLDPVNRDAVAAFFFRMYQHPEFDANPPTTAPFTDVPMSYMFVDQISWLKQVGLTKGYEDGTYRPGAPISREAIAAFMFRALAPKDYRGGPDSPFADVPTDAEFYDEIYWMWENKLTNGYTENGVTLYKPRQNIERGALAEFLFRRFGDVPLPMAPLTAEPEVPTRDLKVSLTWTGATDLDLHVVEPSGDRLNWKQNSTAVGGRMQGDQSVTVCSTPGVAGAHNETATWPQAPAPVGEYTVYLRDYTTCRKDITWTLTVTLDGATILEKTGPAGEFVASPEFTFTVE